MPAVRERALLRIALGIAMAALLTTTGAHSQVITPDMFATKANGCKLTPAQVEKWWQLRGFLFPYDEASRIKSTQEVVANAERACTLEGEPTQTPPTPAAIQKLKAGER